jgi:hypothetical protein
MKSPHLSLAALAVALAAAGCADSQETVTIPEPVASLSESPAESIANTKVTMVTQSDAEGKPEMIGFRFKTSDLEALPKDMNMEAPWFDVNGNGTLDMDLMATPPLVETHGDYKARFDVPARFKGTPFTFLEINWNPMGHPPEPWLQPHLDFHFYTVPRAEVDAIPLGPAAFLIGEEEFKLAVKPVPEGYVGKGYMDVGAAVGKMGNHLIDPTSPELAPKDAPKFTYTFIYGSYDAKVTFWEPMVTREYLLSKQTLEKDINLPAKYAVAGWYPTKYCVRHSDDGYTTVSLEGFVLREAN